MRATNWTTQTDLQTASRRAGGRRAYNRRRTCAALFRLRQVLNELKETGFARGYKSEIARRLGLHRSTINRDFKRLTLLEKGCSFENIKIISQTWHRRTW